MTENSDVFAMWSGLAAEAGAGELHLHPEVAAELHSACAALIADLESMRTVAHRLGTLSGYGDLPSALALAGKFERKAVGGVDALVTRYEQNITVVKLIQETVSHSISRIVEEDRDLAAALPGVEGPR